MGCRGVKIKSLCFLFSEMGWTNKAEFEHCICNENYDNEIKSSARLLWWEGVTNSFRIGYLACRQFFPFTIQPSLDLSL